MRCVVGAHGEVLPGRKGRVTRRQADRPRAGCWPRAARGTTPFLRARPRPVARATPTPCPPFWGRVNSGGLTRCLSELFVKRTKVPKQISNVRIDPLANKPPRLLNTARFRDFVQSLTQPESGAY